MGCQRRLLLDVYKRQETMDAIEKWAADEFRSTNGQLQWIIAEALRKSGRLKKKSSKTGNKPCLLYTSRCV